jgi:signal transduction histidine kinase
MITTDFGDLLATRMRGEHQTLAARWFERLQDLLPVSARDVFPTESLLDHVPALIIEISDYLRQPDGEAIASNTAILDKARELGALRHAQRASLHQVLREYQILGRVLVAFVMEELEKAGAAVRPTEGVELAARLHQAVDVLSQATVETFVGLYTQTISDQSDRLDQFTRMAVHEWRQPLGALAVGVRLIREAGLDGPELEQMLATVERHVHHLGDLTRKLEAIARVRSNADNAVVQRVPVASVAQEAARQLREMAEARGVEIRIADSMPELTLDVGRLELVLVNLLSNAVKYSDPRQHERYVEVVAGPADDRFARIVIRDNGIGIPRASLATIFQRFTRAHADRVGMVHVGGMGLGLSIVDECVRAMNGEIDVQSVEGRGTTFTIALPAGQAAL